MKKIDGHDCTVRINDRDVVLRSTSVKKYQTRPVLEVVADFDVNSSDSNPDLDEPSQDKTANSPITTPIPDAIDNSGARATRSAPKQVVTGTNGRVVIDPIRTRSQRREISEFQTFNSKVYTKDISPQFVKDNNWIFLSAKERTD